MKKYLFILATAALFASCSNNDSIKEVFAPDTTIGFSTFTGKITRAENSPATDKNALEAYHTNFNVWSSKYIALGTTPETYDETSVFTAQVVNHLDADDTADPAIAEGWYYTPIRFWDKSATKYDFYAAAPAFDANNNAMAWIWDNTNKKISIENFEVDGATIAPSSAVDPAAVMPNHKDLMISEDIAEYTNYTTDKVNLSFIHILSRLNIGVKKATPILDNFVVKLESIKVFNMTSNGTFDENEDDADNAVDGGNHSRWLDASTPATFTAGVGYETETEVTTSSNYVYQALIIPQQIAYASGVKLNGTNVDEDSDPYFRIEYSIYTKATEDIKFKQDEIDAAQEGDPAYGKTTDDVKIAAGEADENIGSYKYTYNLADMFNGENSTANIHFNEGWMYTLNIMINPVAIEFDAEVYEWEPATEVEVEVPDLDGV